jgi:hypothetical protein
LFADYAMAYDYSTDAQLIFPTHNITIVSNNLISFLTNEASTFVGLFMSKLLPQALLNKG